MGINVSRPKPSSKCATIEPEIDSARTYSVTAEFESVSKDYKDHLLTVCLSLLPATSLELKKYFSISTGNYKGKLKSKLESLKYSQKQMSQILGMFALKSKAIEGYFFYLNDLTSLRLVFDTKVEVFKEFTCGPRTESELTKNYYRKAKGSFLLQGFQEISSLVKEDRVSGLEMIRMQYEENLLKVNQVYSELLTGKVIDTDIYAATIDQYK